MKTCFIYQPQGTGDIIFTQKIAHHYRSLGYKIVWPLFEYFGWLRPYLAHPDFSFPLLSNDRKIMEPFENSDRFYYLMGSTYAIFRKPVHSYDFVYLSLGPASMEFDEMMTSKYSVADIDFDNWQKYVKLNRNKLKEDDLFYNVLKLTDNSEYVLINENCSSHKINIPPVQGKQNIYIKNVPGYTVFDWIKVIENCQRLITVDTSIPIIADVFMPDHIPRHCINRYAPPTFVDLPKIFKKNWQFCITADDIKL